MASKIKVDQIQTGDGTGTIALQNQLSGMTTASLPALGSAQMPTGSVLQVVQGTHSTAVNQGGTSFADTGLTQAITPSSASSKILVLISQPVFMSVDNTGSRTAFFRLYRDIGAAGTELEIKEYDFLGSAQPYDSSFTYSVNYLDSPNSTASVSYRTQFRLNSTNADVKTSSGGGKANITLIEIAG